MLMTGGRAMMLSWCPIVNELTLTKGTTIRFCISVGFSVKFDTRTRLMGSYITIEDRGFYVENGLTLLLCALSAVWPMKPKSKARANEKNNAGNPCQIRVNRSN